MHGAERISPPLPRASSPEDELLRIKRHWRGPVKPKSAAREKSCSHPWTVTVRAQALTASLRRQSLHLFRFRSSLLEAQATPSILLKFFPPAELTPHWKL